MEKSYEEYSPRKNNAKDWEEVWEKRDEEIAVFLSKHGKEVEALEEKKRHAQLKYEELMARKAVGDEKKQLEREQRAVGYEIKTIKRELNRLWQGAAPEASHMAYNLFGRLISSFIPKAISENTASDVALDFKQDAYLLIASRICFFDPGKKSENGRIYGFETAMYSEFTGLARQYRDGGVSHYQKTKNNISVSSVDAMKKTGKDEKQFEFQLPSDTNVESQYEEKLRRENNKFIHKVTRNYPLLNGKNKNEAIVRTTCLHKFLGGSESFSESMKDFYIEGMKKMESELQIV